MFKSWNDIHRKCFKTLYSVLWYTIAALHIIQSMIFQMS